MKQDYVDCIDLAENIKFIRKVHADCDGLIEVREITKEGESQRKFLTAEQLEQYEPPKDKNVYYGVYTRKGKRGTAEYCKTTKVLFADYDHMGPLDALERLGEKNLPNPSIIIGTGGGVHLYWVLNKRAGKEAVKVIRAISAATNSDPRVAEIARVMRLPGTMNVKQNPVPCFVYEMNNNTYDLEDFYKILDIPEVEETGIKEHKSKRVKEDYAGIYIERPCIKAMLQGVGAGQRNFALGRIVKYLQIKGKSKDEALKVIRHWNSLNKPPINESKVVKDFYYYWNGDYKLLGCSLDKIDQQEILSCYCDRTQCNIQQGIFNLRLDNTVKYNNRLFNYFYKITGNDLMVYGLLIRHKEGLNTSKLNEKLHCLKTGKPRVGRTTLINDVIPRLRGIGLIEVIEGNRRTGQENFYKAIPQGTYGLGYTLATNGAIDGAIYGKISSAEFKLYVLLLKYAFCKGNCYPSLTELAKDLGTSMNSVGSQIKKLEEADYIKRNYIHPNGVKKLEFILLK
jgi:predicted transcriptional regulator